MITIKKKIPIYGGQFRIVFFDDYKLIEKEYGIDNVETSNGISLSRGGTVVVCFETKEITSGLIAHECKHALNYKFKYLGIDLDLDNDEPECYLLSWMVNRVHEQWEKVKKSST